MSAFSRQRLTFIAPLLLCALAFGQADQPPAAQVPPTTAKPSEQPAAGQLPTATPPAKPQPVTPHSVVDAARASKQAQQSAPTAKVYRNKDVKDPGETANTASTTVAPTHPTIGQTSAQSDDQQIQKDRAFEAQALVFKSQIRVEKGKIVAIQNRMTSLKYQFDAWSTEFSQDPTDAEACWTSQYYTPYYKDWCDAGRNLKAQFDAAQAELTQEKSRLDQMQENIRHKGYGNGVYDAD
jgi:hypothetical protein